MRSVCPACHSDGARLFSDRSGLRTVVCRRCGLFFTHPLPSASAIEEGVASSSKYTEDQIAKRDFFRRRAEALLPRLTPDLLTPDMPKPRLLDIGCAIGTELIVASEHGWDAVGIELARSAREIALRAGLDVRGEPLERCNLEDSSFDAVTLNHVLEHQPTPGPFLAQVARVLRPGGLLFVAVPNLYAWLFYLKRSRYSWTFQPDHFLHFSCKTLPLVLRNAGFEVLSCETARSSDYHHPPRERGRFRRALDRLAERHNFGIEIFCLCRA